MDWLYCLLKTEILSVVRCEAPVWQYVWKTTLPRKPQKQTWVNKTNVYFIHEWEKQQIAEFRGYRRNTQQRARREERGIVGNNWSTNICVQTTTSCLHRKSAEGIMGSCHHRLLPFLWRTPDPAAHVPDAPERTMHIETHTHTHSKHKVKMLCVFGAEHLKVTRWWRESKPLVCFQDFNGSCCSSETVAGFNPSYF